MIRPGVHGGDGGIQILNVEYRVSGRKNILRPSVSQRYPVAKLCELIPLAAQHKLNIIDEALPILTALRCWFSRFAVEHRQAIVAARLTSISCGLVCINDGRDAMDVKLWVRAEYLFRQTNASIGGLSPCSVANSKTSRDVNIAISPRSSALRAGIPWAA